MFVFVFPLVRVSWVSERVLQRKRGGGASNNKNDDGGEKNDGVSI